MFKSKSKVRQKRIFTKSRRDRQRFSGLSAVASIILFILALELLTRIFVDLSGSRDEFATTEEKSDLEQAYSPTLVGSDTAETERAGLLVEPSLSVAYKLVGDRKSEYWQINPQGFRDRDPVTVTKPQDEIRIFLLGNSTAFGYGNPSNSATISAYLEARLQQRLAQQKTSPRLYKPDRLPFNKAERAKFADKPAKIKPGKYRVINAAVPGYASGNELAQVALQILKYKPDLIVVMDGYEDLLLAGDKEAVQFPANKKAGTEATDQITGVWHQLRDRSHLVRAIENNWFKSTDNSDNEFILQEETSQLVKHLPMDESQLQTRIDRYLEHQKQILNLSAAAQVPVIVALQPEITGREPSQLTDIEGEIAKELGRTYIDRMREAYPVMISAMQKLANAFPSNIKAIDLYKLTDKYPSPSFVDAIHLNESANKRVAEQLYYGISNFAKMQVVPQQAPAPAPRRKF